ncbi:LacI family DNA-binding transcriptional regulator [Paenibacillus cremeus]|uniref:LacI family transcriptional regulator n=1 Tax=Paenibacillus cremeus TaxID=2163881 RepID=A0A559JRB0_9BACL|nr:LacI family DNA-binding transcriptional regulator [Paenibacillus cremeus]TVY02412.1 LacI family transcriptional regulator [Paenibacillus cremeus]
MATMKDICKRAGVSIATVSAVINKSAYVSPALEERVNKAIQELNYRPNAVARSLKKKSTKTIAAIVTDIENPYYPTMIRGMDDVAFNFGFSFILCNTTNDPIRFRNYLDLIVEKQADGLLLANISTEEELAQVEKTGLKYVLLNRKPPAYDKNYVGINNMLTTELSIKHLASLGYRDIAYFSGDLLISTARERWEGFQSGMHQQGLKVDEALVFHGDYTFRSGYESTKKLLTETKQLPEAICAASDLVAFGAVKALRESGIRIPEDIAIMGNDNNPFSENFIVPLSTVDHPKYEMGKMAMELLLEEIESKERKFPKQIVLPPSLVVRDSCGWKSE